MSYGTLMWPSPGRDLLITAGTIVVAALLLGWVSYTVAVSGPGDFRGTLTQIGGSNRLSGGGESNYCAKFQLTFSPPPTLSPEELVITITAPVNAPMHLGGSGSFTILELHFSPNTYPAWLTILPGGGQSTAFTATVINPGGGTVGGLGFGQQVGPIATSIASGAILNLTFPNGTGPQGFEVTLSFHSYAETLSVMVH
ncbi:MAG: hypothetical protein L3K09_02805 [Thermoplasmata archaeon]|nr:hypothetical protein [Thermoplasmata archaeon]